MMMDLLSKCATSTTLLNRPILTVPRARSCSMDDNPYKAPRENLATPEPLRNLLSFRVGLIALAALLTVALLVVLS